MEQQTQFTPYKPIQLDDEKEKAVVKAVVDADKKGRDARERYEKEWHQCARLYNCIPTQYEDDELKDFSNIVLPWVADAVESAYAYLHSAMIPRNDAMYTINPITEDDKEGADVMSQFLEHLLMDSKFAHKFGANLRQSLIKGHSVIKAYWRNDTVAVHDYQEGQPVQGVRTTYNNIHFDIIDVDDFSFYPIYGEFNKTTRVHRVYRTVDEIKRSAEGENSPEYFNLDKLGKDEENNFVADNAEFREGEDGKEKKKKKGIELKEAWFHTLVIGEEVYYNHIATIAEGKTLIRLQPNHYPDGMSPFFWTSLVPSDTDCLYATGMLSRGLAVLDAAEELFNSRIDQERLNINKPRKYYDDGVINPYQLIARPGALVPVAQESLTNGNLEPLSADNGTIAVNMQELETLKAEFESVTVPKAVKGLVETGQRTATEISEAVSNAAGKLNGFAFHINDNQLTELIKYAYKMVYAKLEVEKDEELKARMALLTQEASVIQQGEDGQEVRTPLTLAMRIAKLPQVLPFPSLDIKVIGFQNAMKRREMLQALSNVIPQLAESPAGKYLKWETISEAVMEAADLDKSRFLMDEDEKKEADAKEQQQAEQQQQLAMQQMQMQAQLEQMKVQIEKFKADSDASAKMKELELKELDLELKYGTEILKNEQQQGESAQEESGASREEGRASSEAG